jgi:IclR family acetate operon transcriptional repressor
LKKTPDAIRSARRVLAVSQGYLEQLSATRDGRPILSEFLKLLNENSALSIRDGMENVVIAQESCTHPLKQAIVIGSRSPFHCTASGKALLAFLPGPERDAILRKLQRERITRRTKNRISTWRSFAMIS